MLKLLLKKQLFEIFRFYFYDAKKNKARSRLATEPTPYLYVQTAYAYSDASNAIIREMGLFMDTEFVEGLPEGQRYFVPDDLKNPGLLLAAQIILPRINRSPSVRQTVEFVLPI